MTNKKNWLGILAIVLVFGMMVGGCDIGEDTSSELVGRWGFSMFPVTLAFEFTEDGRVHVPETNIHDMTFTASGNTITTSFSRTIQGVTQYGGGTIGFDIRGNQLLLRGESGDSGLFVGTYLRMR